MAWIIAATVVALLAVLWLVRDMTQKKSAILRNFPIVGHGRYFLESLGPKLRQYIVASNDEERPFTRDQRHWVYRSAAKGNNYFGFGTDNAIERTPNYLIVKQSAFPINEPHEGDDNYDELHRIPSAKVLGGWRGREKAFRLPSIVNTSAMSYGSLSAVAVEAMNRGCQIAGCLQNTGEGGVAPHHDHGGELVWQIGTGYFGCRDEQGNFSIDCFLDTVERYPVRAIEVKISQGAKPGKGGVLPAAKITPEISQIRGIPMGMDCLSPSSHSAFHDVDSMLDFVEMLAERSGLPVGIKSAVGQLDFWHDLADTMNREQRGVDFIAIDGGEGGTGAAPLVFSDHVALPFMLGFCRVHRIFFEAGMHDKVSFVGSGKLGFPQSALFAFALGCDTIAVGREAMMAVGCIQAQECHTGFCPTGVATQRKWLMRGLVPGVKAHNLANYIVTLRKEILQLCCACGVIHPSLITTDHFEILNPGDQSESIVNFFEMPAESRMPGEQDREQLEQLMNSGGI
ncbi:MAG: FMN-binding glutamate synthase family protein [Pirellulaceae bacterium]